jgi:hypothetical protein
MHTRRTHKPIHDLKNLPVNPAPAHKTRPPPPQLARPDPQFSTEA